MEVRWLQCNSLQKIFSSRALPSLCTVCCQNELNKNKRGKGCGEVGTVDGPGGGVGVGELVSSLYFHLVLSSSSAVSVWMRSVMDGEWCLSGPVWSSVTWNCQSPGYPRDHPAVSVSKTVQSNSRLKEKNIWHEPNNQKYLSVTTEEGQINEVTTDGSNM